MPKRASLGHGQKWLRLRLHFFEFPCCTCRYWGVEVPLCIVFNAAALLSSWVTGQDCQVWSFLRRHSCGTTIEQ